MLYRVHLDWAGFELTPLVVIGTDCTGSSERHTRRRKTKQKQKYNIGILTVNIEFMCRGLQTGERRAISESFQAFLAEPHKFYIYRQYTNIRVS
jgi:transketolase C-terminal domain/subunit